MSTIPHFSQQLHVPSPARARTLRRAAPVHFTLAAGELRARRRRAGLGILRAAELIGVTPGHLSRAERGLRHLGATRIIHALGIYTVVEKSYSPIEITIVERAPAGPVTGVSMYPIAGGSGPARATRDQLQQLADHFNKRRN